MSPGPVRHETLSEPLVARIAAIHEAVDDVFPEPLEQRVEDFRRDADPEREVVIWEGIVAAYRDLETANELGDVRKRDAISVLLGLTMLGAGELLEQKPGLDPDFVRRASAALIRAVPAPGSAT